MTNPGSDPATASQAHSGQTLQATGIRDVAAATGVSTATVSRALRGLPRVSPSTRQRILTAAADLGYVASTAASELARARGTRKATHPEQLQRVEPPASKTASCSLAGPSDVSDHPAKPSRGTILVVIGPPTDPVEPDEPGAPTRAEIERLVEPVAAAHGFTVCLKFCTEAGLIDTLRAATASVVGIVINTASLSPVPTELQHALASAHVPAVEIDVNYYRQRSIHASSPISGCAVLISGAGIYGYKLAIDYLSTAV